MFCSRFIPLCLFVFRLIFRTKFFPLQVDGPSHFYRDGATLRPVGATILKHRQLRGFGHRVLHGPSWFFALFPSTNSLPFWLMLRYSLWRFRSRILAIFCARNSQGIRPRLEVICLILCALKNRPLRTWFVTLTHRGARSLPFPMLCGMANHSTNVGASSGMGCYLP